MTVKIKDPAAVLKYTEDWATFLNAPSPAETIDTSAWRVKPAPSPLELKVDSDSKTNTTATAQVSGGARTKVYRLINKITTSAGRTDERSIIIRVDDT